MYRTDLIWYDVTDNKTYGDMAFTFCEYPDTLCDDLEVSKTCAQKDVEAMKELLTYDSDNNVPIFLIDESIENDIDDYDTGEILCAVVGCGKDTEISNTIESIVSCSYPKAEILFCN